MYEGYVKGMGYAYIEYMDFNIPYFYNPENAFENCNNIFYNPIPLQRVDMTKEALQKSLKFFFTIGFSERKDEINSDNDSLNDDEYISYYENALKYIDRNIPYKLGGIDTTGMDCSGFVSVALNLPSNPRWHTRSKIKPAADLEEIEIKTSSYEEFIECLQEGDILLWEEKGHVAFYAGGSSLVHASCSKGVAKTKDLVVWWLPNRGYPNKVYRQIKK